MKHNRGVTHLFFGWSVWMLLFMPATVLANPYEYTLDNGLKLVVKEDHRSPVVVSQIWYKAGSIDEHNGTTGVAHVLEHMMFKGTEKVPGGEFSKRISAVGGRDNAFTSRDYTGYFQQLHKRHLPLAMEMESDRMRNLILTEEDFAKEIKVVMEERRLRTDDQPHALVYETMLSTAYQAHPYKQPIVGWMNDLENMNVADTQRWYDQWYAPNNAILVVVGDVEHKAVLALAQKYYGQIKASPKLSNLLRKPQTEPAQRGIKRITVKAPAKLPFMLMGYHTPTLRDVNKDWEPYALEMLAGVLDGNASARLNKTLVREQRVANSVGAGYDSIARGPSLFLFSGTPSEGKTVADVEKGIRAEVKKLIEQGVTDEELSRVKAQVIASHVFQRDSIFSQAMQIGRLESIGMSHRDLDTMLEKLKSITGQQVVAVAKKYLQDDGLTVAVLDPQPIEQKQRAAAVNLRH